MPPAFEAYGSRWRDLHPGWEVRDWRSTTELPTLRNQGLFDRAPEIVPNDWKRFQADLLRLELLYRYGGVYVDCDVEPLRPLDDLLDRDVIVAWSPNRGRDGKRLLTQAVLGSVPRHPFIGACLDGIPDAVRRYRGRPLAQMVGPHHIQRVWEQCPHGVEPLSESTFYPQSVGDRDRGRPLDVGESYTHHRWNSSLRRRGRGLG